MKLFATRVWGFDPEIWPVVGFGSVGICANLIRKSSPGDRLVFVGTKGPPTAASEQGRILGFFEFGRDIVSTLEMIEKKNLKPEQYDDRGDFRWPRGLIMTRAWKIDTNPLPDLVDTIGRQFSRDATTMAVDLSEAEADTILSLPYREVPIGGTNAYDIKVRKTNALIGRSQSPVPSDRSGGNVKIGNEAYTYLLRFGKTDCFKVGWSADPKKRLLEVNKHVPVEVMKMSWSLVFTQRWGDEIQARDMEQRVLNAVPQERIIGERFRIDPAKIDGLWAGCL